jgi:ABC-type polysaccharide/polyol phosphate transport system ATPase subunit
VTQTVGVSAASPGSPPDASVPVADEPAVSIVDVSKRYRLYHRDRDRLIEWFSAGRVKRHRDFWALQNVSLDIWRGETLGIIGVNGSGKSTLLQVIAGILKPDSGTANVRGRLTALLELGAGFHPEFTGRENVFMYGQLLGVAREEMARRFDEIAAFAEIGEFLDQPVKTYSSGMVVRLAFAVAVNVDPDVMLVDEALSVGDFRFQRKSYNRMKELQERCTFVVVSHSSQVLMRICNRIAWLHGGRLMAVGDPEATVEAYERHVNGEADTRELERQPYGSGEAVLTRVEMLDAGGRPRTVFPPDAAVTLRVTCQAHQDIERPVFGFIIWDMDHRPVWATNTYWDEVDVGRLHGTHTIEYRIRNLPLLPGRYDLCAAISDSEGAVAYDWNDRALSFAIRDPIAGVNARARGVVNIQGQWFTGPSR